MRLLICIFVVVLLAGCGDGTRSWFSQTKGDKEKAAELYRRFVQRDQDALSELLDMAEGKGDPFASFYAGLAYDPALVTGGDPIKAAQLYQAAIGVAPAARHNLALLILKGVRPPGTGEHTALTYLSEAAQAGKLESMMMLGTLYEQGWEGVARNPALASEWYEKAVEFAKDPRAELRLGLAYLEGVGKQKDIEKGLRYLTAAAKAGIVEAQYEIGKRSGDLFQAAQWLVAAALNDQRYMGFAQRAMESLSPAQREAVQQAARLWVHAHERRESLPAFSKPITEL